MRLCCLAAAAGKHVCFDDNEGLAFVMQISKATCKYVVEISLENGICKSHAVVSQKYCAKSCNMYGNPTLDSCAFRCDLVRVVISLFEFVHKTVFPRLVYRWAGVMSPPLRQLRRARAGTRTPSTASGGLVRQSCLCPRICAYAHAMKLNDSNRCTQRRAARNTVMRSRNICNCTYSSASAPGDRVPRRS